MQKLKLRDVTNSSQRGSPLRHHAPKPTARALGTRGKGGDVTPTTIPAASVADLVDVWARRSTATVAAAPPPPPPVPSGARPVPVQALLASPARTPAVLGAAHAATAEEGRTSLNRGCATTRPSPNTRINNIRERMAGLVRKVPRIWVWLRVVTSSSPPPESDTKKPQTLNLTVLTFFSS